MSKGELKMWSVRRRQQGDPLAELGLPTVANIRDLKDEVSRRVQRPVLLEPKEQQTVCGAVFVQEDAIWVFYDPRTSRLHQDHIIAHEFSHLLLGHHEAPSASSSLTRNVGSSTVQLILGRTTYEEIEERDTERLASLLQRTIIDRSRHRLEPSGDAEQDRVMRTLLHRRETR